MEEDILYYSPTVMFRGTLCSFTFFTLFFTLENLKKTSKRKKGNS